MARIDRRRIRNASVLAAVNLIACAAIVAAAEAALRWRKFGSLRLPPPAYAYDPLLRYKHNPDNPNSRGGFLGGPHSKIKPPGSLRIFCLGGSTTAGYGLTPRESWPHRLQEKLEARMGAGHVEVLNGAVGGYGTQHLLLLLRHVVPEYDPDYVLVYAGWNGVGILSDTYAWTPSNVVSPQDGWLQRFDKFLQNHSTLYLSRIRWRVEGWIRERNLELQDAPAQRNAQNDALWRRDMTAIAALADSLGIRPVFIAFPHWEDGHWKGRGENYRVRMRGRVDWVRDLRKAGRTVFDMAKAFPPSAGAETGRYFFDLMHLNAEGSRRLAEALADSLQPLLAARRGL